MCFFQNIASITLTISALSGNLFAATGDTTVATWLGNAKCAYTFTTDDNNPSQIYDIAPLMSQYGLVSTYFVNPNPTWWSWNTFKDNYAALAAAGNELGSHTQSHYAVVPGHSPSAANPDRYMESYDALRADCEAVNEQLIALTGKPAYTFAYPWGIEDGPTQAVISEYYLSARDVSGYRPTGGYSGTGTFIPNSASPENMYKLDCFYSTGNGKPNTWWPFDMRDYDIATDTFARYLNNTLDAGGWAIEFTHDLYGQGTEGYLAYDEHLENIASEVAEGTLWNATQGDVSRYIYSRDAAFTELLETDDGLIKLSVDDFLDDELYNVPLTINTNIPCDWDSSSISISHNGAPLDFTFCDSNGTSILTFDVIADGTPITILHTVPEPPVAIPGDCNGDGMVTTADLAKVTGNWQQYVTGGAAQGDFNGDGQVTTADLAAVSGNWQYGVTTVPEPSVAILLATLLIALGLRRFFSA